MCDDRRFESNVRFHRKNAEVIHHENTPSSSESQTQRPYIKWLRWVGLGLCLGFIGILVECQVRQSDPNWVASGHFHLTVDGAVSSTVKGKATYTLGPDGALTFLEMEAASQDSTGMSVELNGVRLAPGAFVLYPPTFFSDAIQSAGTAFLNMDDFTFMVDEGEVQIEAVEDGEIRATYHAIMQGSREKIAGEEVMVEVTGVFRAKPEDDAQR